MGRKIWIEEVGCIRHKWVSCKDGISRCLGTADEDDEVVIERGRGAVRMKERMEQLENKLRREHPGKQIYHGFLPAYDVDWDGQEGMYLYVLKNRRRGGKYQVLAAVPIEW
jgi:hypothetical protein